MTPEDWDNVKKLVDDYLEHLKKSGALPPPPSHIQHLSPLTQPVTKCQVCGITWQAGKAYGYCCGVAGCPSRPWS
jgi:hypothetical protein